jgi:hypothetical protein
MEFFPRRYFFRATPLLPGHKLGLEQKKDLKSEGGQGFSAKSFSGFRRGVPILAGLGPNLHSNVMTQIIPA